VRLGDADDFVAAHLLARVCAAAVLGEEPSGVVIEQRCSTCGGPHGRPFVVGSSIHVSWSHASGHVMAAAATRPVGVDLEPVTTMGVDPRLVGTAVELEDVRAAPDPAFALLQLWVMKEALAKVGALTLDDFATVTVADVPGFDVVPVAYPGFAAAAALSRCQSSSPS
jgi:4'-phosphopantetheinyl transferase